MIRFYGYILIAVLFLQCSLITKKKKDPVQNYLAAIVLSQSAPDSYAKLYIASSLLASNSTNTNYLTQVSTASNTAKKKLILIHGWQYNDRDNAAIPTDSDLKKRILTDIWKDVLATDFYSGVLLKSYDLYFFTYLTSSTVDSNGKRLRNTLDAFFSAESGTVTIFGHSMGGLISKAALNESSKPSYISRIITAGTPFHGSPWASPAYQKSKSFLGDVATFMTGTNGGKDLAWDNYDSSITGASNTYLNTLNAKKDRDSLIYAYYGSLDSSGTGFSGSDSSMLVGCASLGTVYAPSDCIVPQTSAISVGNSFAKTLDVGKLSHTDLNLRSGTVRNYLLTDLP